MYHLAYFRLSATATTTTTEHPWQVVFLLCWCLFFQNEMPNSKITWPDKSVVSFGGGCEAQVEDQIHQLKEELQQRKAAQVGTLNAPDYQITRLEGPNHCCCSLVHIFCLIYYSSWIISGFWRPHTHSRRLSRVGHAKDYFWTILKIGRVVLQLMAKRNSNLIELLKWNKTNKQANIKFYRGFF